MTTSLPVTSWFIAAKVIHQTQSAEGGSFFDLPAMPFWKVEWHGREIFKKPLKQEKAVDSGSGGAFEDHQKEPEALLLVYPTLNVQG